MLLDAFDRVFRDAPGEQALVTEEGQCTFRDVESKREDARSRLEGLVRPGDVVALMLPNGSAYVAAMLAVLERGAVVAPFSPSARGADLESGIQRSGARIVMTGPPSKWQRADPISALEQLVTSNAVEIDAIVNWGDPSEPTVIGEEVRARIEPQDPAMIFFTSGTGGPARGILHTHDTLVAPLRMLTRFAELTLSELSPAELEPVVSALADPVRMSLLPFWTIAGHSQIVQALANGQVLVTLSQFEPRRALDLIAKHRVTNVIAVPTMIALLLRAQERDPRDLSSVFLVGMGGAAASEALVRRVHEILDCRVVQGYGSTELGGGVVSIRLSDARDRQAATVGRPNPGVQLRVVDDDGNEVLVGDIGELQCRVDDGSGYDLDTGLPFARPDSWYGTGDLASIDHDGFVAIVGRKDDVIIRGGLNVHPLKIESVLESHPEIEQAAVVGAASETLGESIVAFIIPKRRSDLTPDRVRQFVGAHLPNAEVPDVVMFEDSLPMTDTGKVRRAELRARLRRQR